MADVINLKTLSGTDVFKVEDTGVTVPGTLAVTGNVTLSAGLISQLFALATITAANATGGATTTTMTLQLKDMSNTNLTSVRKCMILVSSVENGPAAVDTSVTFSSPTAGSIVESGNGWAIVETSSAGAFACTLTNATDETLYLRAISAEVNESAQKACIIVGSNSDAVAWSA